MLLYKTIVKCVALLLFSLKFLYLYVSYLVVCDIFKMDGFLSILIIIGIWFCFNTVTERLIFNILEQDSGGENC